MDAFQKTGHRLIVVLSIVIKATEECVQDPQYRENEKSKLSPTRSPWTIARIDSHRCWSLFNYWPRCFRNESWTDSPAATSSFTRSSAAIMEGNKSRTFATLSWGMITTPLAGSLKTRSPGLTIVPSRFSGIWTAWALASNPVPMIDVDLDHIYPLLAYRFTHVQSESTAVAEVLDEARCW